MNLREAIALFDLNVEIYQECSIDDIDAVNEVMKNIGIALHYLTKERIEYNRKWEAVVFRENGNGLTNAAAKTIANNEVPELYKIRRIQETGTQLHKGIISHFSRLKQEQ